MMQIGASFFYIENVSDHEAEKIREIVERHGGILIESKIVAGLYSATDFSREGAKRCQTEVISARQRWALMGKLRGEG